MIDLFPESGNHSLFGSVQKTAITTYLEKPYPKNVLPIGDFAEIYFSSFGHGSAITIKESPPPPPPPPPFHPLEIRSCEGVPVVDSGIQ